MAFLHAKEFQAANKYNIDFTNKLMDEFYGWIQWRPDGKDTLLDIGSGPANSLRMSFYPRLPKSFERFVCSDISPPMVDLQKQEFRGYDKVSSVILDISADISDDLAGKLGTFDHITSFSCLHWISDQQKAMDNIFKLLKPGGDAFLSIVADSPINDAILEVCDQPQWKEFFESTKDFYIHPYFTLDEAKAKGLGFMKKAGFVDLKAELREEWFDFKDDDEKENFLRGFPNIFSKEATEEEEEMIFRERVKVLDKFVLFLHRNNVGKIRKPNSYLILYGRKEQ
ncbi:hypothetical protein DMENIID0001_162920 [Sergentomyia squamirostris]